MQVMIKTICVCGAGTMGRGIAQVSAAAGFHTMLYELDPSVLDRARQAMEKDLGKLVEKQKITSQKKSEIEGNLKYSSSIHDCIADLIIEAIVEKPEAKTALFNSLSVINTGETIFATNTSSLSITSLAASITKPERVAGLHFFNPAPIMKLVEVVMGDQTSREVKDQLVELTKQMGKSPVVCKDSPGFIVNRVARPFYIESLRIAEEGITYETIDRLLEGRGFKMGPFRLMDLIGNDINYAVSCSVYEQLGKPERLKPSIVQEEKVRKGDLGKKTGKGYYNY